MWDENCTHKGKTVSHHAREAVQYKTEVCEVYDRVYGVPQEVPAEETGWQVSMLTNVQCAGRGGGNAGISGETDRKGMRVRGMVPKRGGNRSRPRKLYAHKNSDSPYGDRVCDLCGLVPPEGLVRE